MNEKQLDKWAKKLNASKSIVERIKTAIDIGIEEQTPNLKDNQHLKVEIKELKHGVEVFVAPADNK